MCNSGVEYDLGLNVAQVVLENLLENRNSSETCFGIDWSNIQQAIEEIKLTKKAFAEIEMICLDMLESYFE